MKILLVFPARYTKYGLPRYPPLGLSYMGAVLKENGHEVRALDMRLKGNDVNKLLKIVEDFKPDLISLTSLSFLFKKVVDIAKRIKEIKKEGKDILIVVGGPHVGMAYKEVISVPYIDFALIGEGEYAFLELADKLQSGEKVDSVRGLVYRKNNKVFFKGERACTEDLDKMPYPAFDLFPIEKYKVRGKLILPIMTSRGCPYNCIYCSSYKTFGKKFRKRSPENVVEEVKHDIKKYGVKNFTIIDDIFSLDIDRAIKMCDLIIKEKLNIMWSCDQGIRADRVNKELLTKMKKSGCKLIAIGVESANQGILDNLNKAERLETIRQTIKDAHEAGLIVKAFFLVGSPGETMENVKESIKFFKETNIDIPRFSMLHPYPNTKLWDWMYNNATVLKDPYNFVTESTHSEKVDVVYETKEFTREERLNAFKLAEEESEKWIIRKALERKLGKISKLVYPIFTIKIFRNIIKLVYRLRLVSATD